MRSCPQFHPVAIFMSWSLVCWFFPIQAATAAGIVLSEIHYHPVERPAFNADGTPVLDLSEDVHEFVELFNAGTST